MTRLWIPAALLLLAAACSAPGASGGAPRGDLMVGMVTSLSGVSLSSGVEARLGAEQAVDEVNRAGGVGGRRGKLLVADDQSTAAGSEAAFNQVAAAGAIGVLGPLVPEGVARVEAIAGPRRLPLLSLSGADQLLGSGSRPPGNLFLAAPAASRVAERMLDHARSASLTRVAVAHELGDPYADSALAALAREAPRKGITIVSDEPFDPARVDFDPMVKRLRATGARALLAWGRGAGIALLTRAWGAYGRESPILLGPSASTTDFLRTVGDGGEGSLIVTCRAVLLEAGSVALPKAIAGMAREFQQRNGYYPSQAALDAYAAARLLLRAVAAAGSTAPGRISAALAGLSLETAAGNFRYTAADHLGLPLSGLLVAVVRNGRLIPA